MCFLFFPFVYTVLRNIYLIWFNCLVSVLTRVVFKNQFITEERWNKDVFFIYLLLVVARFKTELNLQLQLQFF